VAATAPFTLRGSTPLFTTIFIMLQNYLTIAWRNLRRHKSFSLINIAGLAAGLAACILIFLYVHYELTYDQHHEKANRIARIVSTLHTPGSDMEFGTSPYPLGAALKRDFPEIEETVTMEQEPSVIRHQNKLFEEEAFYNADSRIFTLFSYSFIGGSPATSLSSPHSLVLTASTARKYFGSASAAIGQTLICNKVACNVTGVIDDPPGNADIKVTGFLSFDYSRKNTWMEDFSAYTFVLFRHPTDLRAFEKKIKPIANLYCQAELDGSGDKGYSVSFAAEALKDVHFSTAKLIDTPKGNRQFNYMFSLLAAFILVIALLNYINLSTARATERAKEVGVRKVHGARPVQLIRQFLLESFLLIFMAWLLAFAIVLIALPYFNGLLGVQLRLSWGTSALFLLAIFAGTVLLAGLYPAFIQSRFNPISTLKGKWRHSLQGITLRKVLTTAQFVITAALITGTVVIYSQLRFINDTNPGYVKDQLAEIRLPMDSASQAALPAFAEALRQHSAVKALSMGSGIRKEGLSIASTFAGSGSNRREMMCNYFFIDPDFLPLLQIQLKAGRNLSDSLALDKKTAFLVNEAFAAKMGWSNAIGQSLEGFGKKGSVVGVVKNFYYQSMHNVVEPLIMVYREKFIQTVIVKIQPKDVPVIADIWKAHYPGEPVAFSYMDESYQAQYARDRLTMKLFTFFTSLAIIISCLGLYGLVSLITIQRSKEIGIRKVLGASLQQLISLLTKDFMGLVLIASLIALPAAGIAMHQWLTNYAYHISLTWWMFALPLVAILFIALAVIGQQVVKASLANPVIALRSE